MVLIEIGAMLAGLYAAHAVKESVVGYAYQHQIDQLEGGLDVIRDFELILRANGIKRTQFDSLIEGGEPTYVLAETSYYKCLNFIYGQPLSDDDDEQLFIQEYERVRQEEIDARQKVWNREYEQIVADIVPTKEYTIFEMRMVGCSKTSLIDAIYENTIFGELSLKKGQSKLINSSWIHFWAVRLDKSSAERVYRACARRMGVDLY